MLRRNHTLRVESLETRRLMAGDIDFDDGTLLIFGDIGDGKDIAYPMVFLRSDKAKWIVGADLNVSAGRVVY